VAQRTPSSDGLVFEPIYPQEQQVGRYWGQFEDATKLPNVGFIDSGSVTGVNPATAGSYEALEPGDVAFVGDVASPPVTPIEGTLYVCTDPGTPGGSDANWDALSTPADDLPVVQARRTSVYALTGAFVDITLDTTDVENDPAIIEHDNTLTARINIKESGLYGFTFNLTTMVSAAGTHSARLQKNGAGADIPGTLRTYTDSNDSQAMGDAIFVELTAGDFVTLQLMTTGTASTLGEIVLTAWRARGTKGAKGDTGSGSTITVEDEGIVVGGGPHDTLNFIGDAVAVTDAGGGTADITISVGYTVEFGGKVDGAGKFAVSGASPNEGAENSASEKTTQTVPKAGTMKTLAWHSKSATAATIINICKNGIVVETITLSGVSGTDSTLTTTVVAGDELDLQEDAASPTDPDESFWILTIE